MPAINFEVTWPDGDTETYYSPSTVIREHLKSGDHFGQDEFGARVSMALNAASERVREKFGYYCSAASDELEKINMKLSHLRAQDVAGEVLIIRVD